MTYLGLLVCGLIVTGTINMAYHLPPLLLAFLTDVLFHSYSSFGLSGWRLLMQDF